MNIIIFEKSSQEFLDEVQVECFLWPGIYCGSFQLETRFWSSKNRSFEDTERTKNTNFFDLASASSFLSNKNRYFGPFRNLRVLFDHICPSYIFIVRDFPFIRVLLFLLSKKFIKVFCFIKSDIALKKKNQFPFDVREIVLVHAKNPIACYH